MLAAWEISFGIDSAVFGGGPQLLTINGWLTACLAVYLLDGSRTSNFLIKPLAIIINIIIIIYKLYKNISNIKNEKKNYNQIFSLPSSEILSHHGFSNS